MQLRYGERLCGSSGDGQVRQRRPQEGLALSVISMKLYGWPAVVFHICTEHHAIMQCRVREVEMCAETQKQQAV